MGMRGEKLIRGSGHVNRATNEMAAVSGKPKGEVENFQKRVERDNHTTNLG